MSQPDFLIEFIRNLGLRSNLFSRTHLCAPWGFFQESVAEMVFHYVVDGECCLWVGGMDRESVALASGDFVLLPRGSAHGMANARSTALRETDRICYTAEQGRYKFVAGSGRESRFLCGSFTLGQTGANVLLESLPELVVIRLDDSPQKNWIKSTLALVEHETYADRPGKELVLAHLLDVLFMQILRWCLEDNGCEAVGLLGAVRDPELRHAMEAMLGNVRHPWQLGELADLCGLSRSTFAERFTRIVGETPMAFLRQERLRRAMALLEEGVLSVKEVAREVGFSRAEVFIRCFEKAYGESPSRRRAKAHPDGTSVAV